MEFFKSDKIYNFMDKRKQFMLISIIFIFASIVLIFTKGLNFGIDFKGGTIIQVKYNSLAPLKEIRKVLKESKKFQSASVNFFGSNDEVIIKLASSTNNLAKDIGDEIKNILKPTGKFKIRRIDMVGPKVGSELTSKGLTALTLAIIVILIYVSFRFEWRFALASILALVHDITISIGALSLTQYEINLDILAALLTILGYSINDTIIVFDRIREGITTSKESNLALIINESVSKTLSRTTLTSLTTFFVVLTLFLFGGEIIKGFSFTLLVGVVVGTYSSIFIAASLLVMLNFSVSGYRKMLAEKLKREKEKERLRAQFEGGVV